MAEEFHLEDFYIVEVNDGIYLNLDFEVYEYKYYFTEDFRKSHKFDDFDKAVEIAEKCGGTIKVYRNTHKLMLCDEVL